MKNLRSYIATIDGRETRVYIADKVDEMLSPRVCKRGHPRTPENIYFHKGKAHGCIPCIEIHNQERLRKLRNDTADARAEIAEALRAPPRLADTRLPAVRNMKDIGAVRKAARMAR